MNSLGFYLGINTISIIETSGKKIVKRIQVPYQASSEGLLEDKVPDEVKIVAICKDELRKNKIEVKEAVIALSGKDLIVRNFEMPSLPPEELDSAVKFEVKKYIPFKIEELVSDYQSKLDKNKRKQILYLGIKKLILDKYRSVFTQLNIKPLTIEYSGFSVLRLLKLAGVKSTDISGVITADLEEENEINFVVLEGDFPLFSRDINIPKETAEDTTTGAEAASTRQISLDKLKSEIRISFDFYNRKFAGRNIKKFYLISSEAGRLDLEAVVRDMGIIPEFIDVRKFLDKNLPFSVSLLKAYSVSLLKTVKSEIRIDLLTPKERKVVRPTVGREMNLKQELTALFSGIHVNFKLILLGMLLCFGIYAFGFFQRQPIIQQIEIIKKDRPSTATVSGDSSYEDLANARTNYQQKVEAFNNLFRNQVYLTEPLNTVPQIIPEGVWLSGIEYSESGENEKKFILSGYAYKADAELELQSINDFVARLRTDSKIERYFKIIDVASVDRTQLLETDVTKFQILCISRKSGGAY